MVINVELDNSDFAPGAHGQKLKIVLHDIRQCEFGMFFQQIPELDEIKVVQSQKSGLVVDIGGDGEFLVHAKKIEVLKCDDHQ